jgi:hypothetical protein
MPLNVRISTVPDPFLIRWDIKRPVAPVCRDKNLRGELMERLSSRWSCVLGCQLAEDVNEVVFATSSPRLAASKDQARKSLAAGFKLVNEHVKKALQNNDEELIDIQSAVKRLSINR